ncbi:MAG: hypothetical protein IPL47_11720 [Phyllobacteriaceae bacterium]|nr:hypothetical protein [Phyllobacteriaceae bacterium]
MAKSLYFLALALLTSGAVVLAGGFAGYPTDKSVLAGLFVEAAAFAAIRFRYLPDKRLLSTIKPDLLLLLLALFAYAACLNFFIES